MVKIVSQDYGLPEYRNPEHHGARSGPISACLLVAQELDLDERCILRRKLRCGLRRPELELLWEGDDGAA